MDLLQGCQGKVDRAEGRLELLAIGGDVCGRIPFHEAKIKQFFAVEHADTAGASAETVDQPGEFGIGSELKDL